MIYFLLFLIGLFAVLMAWSKKLEQDRAQRYQMQRMAMKEMLRAKQRSEYEQED